MTKFDPTTLSRKKLLRLVHKLSETFMAQVILDKVTVEALCADPALSPGGKELLEHWFVASRELHARHDADVLRLYGIVTPHQAGEQKIN